MPSSIGDVHGVSIIGEIEGKYYSSTYAYPVSGQPDAGAGFIAAMKVGSYSAVKCNAESGTTSHSVNFSARVEPAGEYAARVIYTLKNNATVVWLLDDGYRTVSLGVWADIMIGDNDSASIYCLRNEQGQVYGLDMKYKKDELAEPGEKVPVFTAIFGDGINGVTPVDDWWFGQYCNNYTLNEISGATQYDNKCDVQHGSGSSATWDYDVEDEFYKVEGETYDSGMGFCWRNMELAAGETVELSFLVSVSEIDIDEPEPDPEAEYHVEVYDIPEWNDLPADHPARVWGYYKHPFGLNGHMEYSVDGGEWLPIEGELVSNTAFDLNFNLNFNPDVDDIHTLKLRINNQGSYTYLDELDQEWEDVRTIDMTVNPETQVYDGTPKTFVVTLGGVLDYPVEYTEPGKYEFPIYGDYDMQTIGVNTVYFYIKYQPELNVVVPEDCVYDGEEHAATYTYNGDGDVIVTYKDSEGNISTEAPVEPGTYEVFVEVTETENYVGMDNTSYGSFTISKIEPELIVIIPEDCVYDGNEHPATVIYNGDGDVIVTYVPANRTVDNEGPVEPGTYAVFVEVTEGAYYAGIEKKNYGEFTIDRRPCEYTAVFPEKQIKYDGNQHGATITVPEGSGNVTVIYKNLGTGEESTTPPTEVGRYAIILSIDDSGEYYYGMDATIIYTYEIYLLYPTAVDELNADQMDNGAWYTIDGRRVAAPTNSGIYIHNGKKYIVK